MHYLQAHTFLFEILPVDVCMCCHEQNFLTNPERIVSRFAKRFIWDRYSEDTLKNPISLSAKITKSYCFIINTIWGSIQRIKVLVTVVNHDQKGSLIDDFVILNSNGDTQGHLFLQPRPATLPYQKSHPDVRSFVHKIPHLEEPWVLINIFRPCICASRKPR